VHKQNLPNYCAFDLHALVLNFKWIGLGVDHDVVSAFKSSRKCSLCINDVCLNQHAKIAA
jgi:hypothetical protein